MYLGILEQNTETNNQLVTILDLPGDDFIDDSQYNQIVINNNVVLENGGFKFDSELNSSLEIKYNNLFYFGKSEWTIEFDFYAPFLGSGIYSKPWFRLFSDPDFPVLKASFTTAGGRRAIFDYTVTENNLLFDYLDVYRFDDFAYKDEYVSFKFEFRLDDSLKNKVDIYYRGNLIDSQPLPINRKFPIAASNPIFGFLDNENSNAPPFYLKNIKISRVIENINLSFNYPTIFLVDGIEPNPFKDKIDNNRSAPEVKLVSIVNEKYIFNGTANNPAYIRFPNSTDFAMGNDLFKIEVSAKFSLLENNEANLLAQTPTNLSEAEGKYFVKFRLRNNNQLNYYIAQYTNGNFNPLVYIIGSLPNKDYETEFKLFMVVRVSNDILQLFYDEILIAERYISNVFLPAPDYDVTIGNTTNVPYGDGRIDSINGEINYLKISR